MFRSSCKWVLLVALVLGVFSVGATDAQAFWGWGCGWGYSYGYYAPYYSVGYGYGYGYGYGCGYSGCYSSYSYGCGWGCGYSSWGCCSTCYSSPCCCYDTCCTYDPCCGTTVVNSAPVQAAPNVPTKAAPESAPADPAPMDTPPAPATEPFRVDPNPATDPYGRGTNTGPTAASSGVLTVWVPYDAKVTINGHQTTSVGSQRQFVSHGLTPGLSYKYVIHAEVIRDGKPVSEDRTVVLTAGDQSSVAFGFNVVPEGLAAGF